MGPWPRRLGLAIMAGAVLGVIAVAGLFHAFDRPGALTGHVVLVVPKGAGVGTIGELLELFSRNNQWNDEAARKQLVKIFDALGPADPQTVEGRKRLSLMLFS